MLEKEVLAVLWLACLVVSCVGLFANPDEPPKLISLRMFLIGIGTVGFLTVIAFAI